LSNSRLLGLGFDAVIVRAVQLIPNPLVSDSAGDSQAGGNLIQHRNLWEDCDGVGGWASG
jgi:hypothetical protein